MIQLGDMVYLSKICSVMNKVFLKFTLVWEKSRDICKIKIKITKFGIVFYQIILYTNSSQKTKK